MKPAVKNNVETLRMSLKMVRGENLPHELLLTQDKKQS